MRAKEFTTEEMHPAWDDLIDNPFDESMIRLPVYHATNSEFSKFIREAHGVFVSQHYDYAAAHYGSNVIPLYIDIRKPYNGGSSAPYVDAAFARDYKTLAKWLKKLGDEGYDCASMYGDGSSLILIGDVPIAHAITGEAM